MSIARQNLGTYYVSRSVIKLGLLEAPNPMSDLLDQHMISIVGNVWGWDEIGHNLHDRNRQRLTGDPAHFCFKLVAESFLTFASFGG